MINIDELLRSQNLPLGYGPQPTFTSGGLFVDNTKYLKVYSVGSMASVTCTLNWVIERPGSTPQIQSVNFTANSSRSGAVIASYPLNNGVLTRVSVEISKVSGNKPSRGQTYVVIDLVDNPSGTIMNDKAIPLIKGYLTTSSGLTWANGVGSFEDSCSGQGYVYYAQITNPAAGADINNLTATNIRWKIRAISATFVTSSAAVTRSVVWLITDTSSDVVAYLVPITAANTIFTQTATQTVNYSGYAGNSPLSYSANSATANQSVATIPWPNDLFVVGSTRIKTSTLNIDSADQWSAIWLLVEEWLIPT